MEFRFSSSSLWERVKRVSAARKDSTVMRTARTLLHERLLDLEQHGDPAAIPSGGNPPVTPGDSNSTPKNAGVQKNPS